MKKVVIVIIVIVLIGIGAVVLNDALIKSGSVIGAGAVVGEGMQIGPLELAVGIPAKFKKTYDSSRITHNIKEAGIYIGLAREYMKL